MPHRWNEVAITRQHQIESGLDLTFCNVFMPYFENAVTSMCPKSLLEIGCGTGHLIAAMCKHAMRSTAIEPSSGMHAIAKELLSELDVTLLQCTIQDFKSSEPFDMIISHLCVQTVRDLDSFLSAVYLQMDEHSTFVFSIPHPCFYNDYKRFFTADEYRYMEDISKIVSFTITKAPDSPISGVPYYHRPLSRYFSSLHINGFTVTDWNEVFPSTEVQQNYGQDWFVPRYCAFHCRKQ